MGWPRLLNSLCLNWVSPDTLILILVVWAQSIEYFLTARCWTILENWMRYIKHNIIYVCLLLVGAANRLQSMWENIGHLFGYDFDPYTMLNSCALSRICQKQHFSQISVTCPPFDMISGIKWEGYITVPEVLKYNVIMTSAGQAYHIPLRV